MVQLFGQTQEASAQGLSLRLLQLLPRGLWEGLRPSLTEVTHHQQKWGREQQQEPCTAHAPPSHRRPRSGTQASSPAAVRGALHGRGPPTAEVPAHHQVALGAQVDAWADGGGTDMDGLQLGGILGLGRALPGAHCRVGLGVTLPAGHPDGEGGLWEVTSSW